MTRTTVRRLGPFAAAVLVTGAVYAESPIVPAVPAAAATPATPATPATLTNSTTDQVLDALHDRGVTLTAFTADVRMTDTSQLGDSSTRDGHVQYQVKPDGSPRLHVLFDTRHFGNKPPVPDKKEYLLEDGWLTDRSYGDKNETRRQFVRPGEKVNLFDLATGPFPLPIGQDKAAVHKAFAVTMPKADKTDPPGTVHLLLTPNVGTALAKQFLSVDVWVDMALRMPVRIETVEKKGNQLDRTTAFTKLVVNPKLTDADFALPAVPGMQTHDEPLPPAVVPPPAGK